MARLKKVNRNRLRQRAERKAANKYAPQRARLQGEKKAIRRDYQTQIGAEKGAARASRDAYRAYIDYVKDSGLTGLARRQALAEFRGGIDSSRNSVGFARASLRPEMRADLASVDDQLFTLAQSQRSAEDSAFNSMLSRKRAQVKRQNTRIRERRQHGKELSRTHKQDLRAAVNEIEGKIGDDLGYDASAKQFARDRLQKDATLRREMFLYLVNSQGITETAAQEAIRRFVKRKANPQVVHRQKLRHGYGLLGPPGVYAAGDD